MSSNGIQKINATKDHTKEAGKRYAEIRDIINKNSDFPFKKIIQDIAGVTAGTFYNYTSIKSEKYGCVSLYTVENMSRFFDLPMGIFDCTMPFDQNCKDIIAKKVRSKFKSNKFVKNTISNSLKELASQIINENDVAELNQAISIIDDIKDIAQGRLNTLNKLENLKK